MTLEINVDVSRAMAAAVGERDGLTQRDFDETAVSVRRFHAFLEEERKTAKYGFYDLHKDTATLAEVKAAAKRFAEFGYENLVVLGIGGSALGITALNTALNPPYYNLLDAKTRKGCPRLFVMDNIDPDTFQAMLELCPPEKTLYNVISKSGGTAETMTQLLIVVESLVNTLGADSLKDHLVVTTSPKAPDAPKSLLHPVADTYGLTSFVIPLNVGGRFSVFSPVGLFPAAMLGMDLDEMMAGCASMDARCSTPELMDNPAYLCAAAQYLMHVRKGKPMTVMMPYSDALRDVADWYRQLWAESLGKKKSLDGEDIFAGQTPIKSLGATDQHSQVQLYCEGPNDKVFLFVETERFGCELGIPSVLPQVTDLDYLKGKTMNMLMAAELQGTMGALMESKRPAVRISMPCVEAGTVAQLLYMLEVATAMAGRLYNVNAFDQPGVEAGKKIARRLMGGEA